MVSSAKSLTLERIPSGNTDAEYLQEDLDKLAEWEGKWKMAFHPDKCNNSQKKTNSARIPPTWTYT
jgi:hypothetical protein